MISPVRSSLGLFLAILLTVPLLAACEVDDPGPGDTISTNTPLDALPDTTVPYGPSSYQQVDIYNQGGSTTGLAIVFVHAGGWCCGTKTQAEGQDYTQYLIDQGHVLMSIDYTTLSPPVSLPSGTPTWPQNLHDVQWAIAWANKSTTKSAYGYSRVVVLGASAGGHLAALATTADALPPGMSTSLNPKPDAGVALVPPIDMITYGDQPGQAGNGLIGASFLAFWGAGYNSPNDVPLLARLAASPWLHVDANDPAIYIASGENDIIAPPAQNGDQLEQFYINQGPGTYWAWNDVVNGGSHNIANDLNITRLDQFLAAVDNGNFD